MAYHWETIISFRCPACGRYVSTRLAVPEPYSESPVEFSCPRCAQLFEGECAMTDTSCDVTVADRSRTRVSAEFPSYLPDDTELEGWIPPDNPMEIFADSHHHTLDILSDHGGDSGAHLINRMVFSHQISAMEAYLSDTLINLVSKDAEAMKRLIMMDKELSAKRFTLAQASRDERFVNSEVLSYLRSVIYHNIPKVHALYKMAANIDVIKILGDDKAKLFKAIELRHDCVHRNGRDSNGKQLDVFTTHYVEATANLLMRLVEEIEKIVNPFTFRNLDDEIPF